MQPEGDGGRQREQTLAALIQVLIYLAKHGKQEKKPEGKSICRF